ncbi:hypothetical protein PLICRDRAFT_114749 [Plicaturopsis crispa FD-325 SS-3]|nr:hypothetical protein PLICRDRAFT_114749 [Plicaturopsis crispa FD-325 SS-3]
MRPRRFPRLRLRPRPLAVGLSLAGAGVYLASDATSPATPRTPTPLHEPPLSDLLRTYAVYTLTSLPSLVDAAPRILDALLASPLPGVSELTRAVVRATFFKQFVGGETAAACTPLLARMRQEGVGALFAYSVEVGEPRGVEDTSLSGEGQMPAYKRAVEEMIRSIDVAGDFEDGLPGSVEGGGTGRRTWVAVKMTALLPSAASLARLSAWIVQQRTLELPFPGTPSAHDLDVFYPTTGARDAPLTPADIIALRALHADLVRICETAERRGVRIIVDAEYTWYQPAVDALTHSLMRKFNALPKAATLPGTTAGHVQPLVYATYQAYLRRTPLHLAHSLADAQANGYALGVKLVRGAYHPHEIAAHPSSSYTAHAQSISPDTLPPVWLTKAETDACYHACLRLLVWAVAEDVWRARGTTVNQTYADTSIDSSKAVTGVGIGVLFGTHNWANCRHVLEEMVAAGLASKESGSGVADTTVVRIPNNVAERVCMGQLYGMSDALTASLVNRTRCDAPFVIKYIPYGALEEVMPYLARRAIENKSVLFGGAAAEDDNGAPAERRRAGQEIRRRMRAWIGL